MAKAKLRRHGQLAEPGQFFVAEGAPDGGADGAGVDRVGVALHIDFAISQRSSHFAGRFSINALSPSTASRVAIRPDR